MPLFSVIIPTYNRADLLIEALDSVARQTCRDFEVIVVDGGADDTPERVAQEYPEAQLVRQTDRGLGPARNLGARRSQGEYLVFLDSDDLWFPWTLATLKDVVDRRRPAVLFYESLRFRHVDELAPAAPQPVVEHVFDDVLSLNNRSRFAGGCALALRRDVFFEVDGFVDAWISAEDLDLVMRLGLAGKLVAIERPPLIGYRQHAAAMSNEGSNVYRGMTYLLDQEARGAYPGGTQRRPERLHALGEMMRHAIAQFVFKGQWRHAIRLYARSFPLFLRIRRWRSMCGLPLLPFMQLLRRGRPIG
jgi:glycosyltransferase involved in cell wall biosynthesis